MEVILDELTPFEFFKYGGIVKITIENEELLKECNVKKKSTFFEYKAYIRFLRNIYMIYQHNHPDNNSFDSYKFVNKSLKLEPSIGHSEYVVDLNYDMVRSYETAKFYYFDDKTEPEVQPRDPYGIPNVCFSSIDDKDERWKEYTQQRLLRGFDDSELWNLDGTIAKFIYPRLKAYLEKSNEIQAIPGPFKTYDEWKNVLEEMVNGFELLSSDRVKTDDEKELEKKALQSFSEYFFGLWL